MKYIDASDDLGQGTVEYALVISALLAICIALSMLWHVLSGGLFVEHALQSAPYHLRDVAPGAIADVLLV